MKVPRAPVDVTGRSLTERQMRDSLRLLDQSAHVANVGGWELNVETQALQWTDEVFRLHHVGPEFQLSLSEATRLYTPECRAAFAAAVQSAIRAGTPFDLEVSLVVGQGRRIWLRAQGVAECRAGRTTRLYGAFQDITERQRTDELGRLQTAALQVATDAVIITDRAGVIEWANPAFTRLSGYPMEEVLGRNSRDLIKSGKHPKAFYRDFWESILSGQTWHGEMINRRKDGSLYTEEQVVSPFANAAGSVTHFVAIKKDLTERRQLEAQYRQAQRMESVGQLCSGVAHDFNNLLTVINGLAELLLSQIDTDAPIHADLQEILHAGERAAILTRQLLAFSRLQIVERRVVSMNTLVTGMESLLRRLLGGRIDLVAVLSPESTDIKADPGLIEQVISNLVVNARDAMVEGGRLTIETEIVIVDQSDARLEGEPVPPGAYVRLAVNDSGGGMDAATLARAVEPFFTTKEHGKGTGLGLSMVYGIVKQSGGLIGIHSDVGHGTSVRVYLPRTTEAANPRGTGPLGAPCSGAETILVAEDNLSVRKLAARILGLAGYTVLEVTTGEEALGLLRHREQPVHLLLTDVVMPGMTGGHLAEQLALTHPAMKVIYMSGYASDTIVRHGLMTEQIQFLHKPFSANTLLQKVRDVLDA